MAKPTPRRTTAGLTYTASISFCLIQRAEADYSTVFFRNIEFLILDRLDIMFRFTRTRPSLDFFGRIMTVGNFSDGSHMNAPYSFTIFFSGSADSKHTHMATS